MIHFLKGYAEVLLTGAEPIGCLNRFSRASIAFWSVEQPDELHLRLCVYRNDLQAAERLALRSMCTMDILREAGLPLWWSRLRRRPVLIVGLLASLALSVLLQSYVWTVRVEGTQSLSEREILHALAEEGVGFGSYGPDISSPLLRMRMQLRLPKITWLAANRNGGVLNVIVREREDAEPRELPTGPANVVAARAGIITTVSALNGTAAVKPGDTVSMGDLLISGITTWERGSQLTRASGEVYAETCRQISVKTPELCLEKRYTGASSTELCVIFGRNRRKIFGNSSIFPMSCDKMVERRVCTLPGGDTLPLVFELTRCRYYETAPVTRTEADVRARLERFAAEYARRSMIAGKILQTTLTLTKEKGSYLLAGALNCEEMISRTAPISWLGEDEQIGKTD